MRRKDFVAFRLKQVDKQIERLLIVINDQNSGRIFLLLGHHSSEANDSVFG